MAVGDHLIVSLLTWVYRLPIGLQIIFAVLVILGISHLPKFPRYLLSMGQRDEGVHVVSALAGEEVDPPYMKKQAHITTEAFEAIGELEIKRIYSWVLRRSISDALSPGLQQFSQQPDGCNAVIYFA
ncbi:hypothetical protein FISHEDRAFT_59370 [Fistulina hepatica ATCC 64428]|uniref:Uncharacterized protein n=1 Tax=Fistulina hepatica ATCC 64428 TaxID=1128425 RepID=A0A0D7ACT9_9AGAR|nr:hypothetical protein FISHEDRAFT_59370 [Fistulina hepatica ATCC 64428]